MHSVSTLTVSPRVRIGCWSAGGTSSIVDAAVARPRSTAYGTDAYATLELKAAALLLLHSLVRNHALVDGNKRLGWLAAAVFLHLNGRTVTLGQDEAFDLVMATASGQLDVDQIAGRLGAG